MAMQSLLRPLSLGLLLSIALPVLAQSSEADMASAVERGRPLNLSLPPGNAVTSVPAARNMREEANAVAGRPEDRIEPGACGQDCGLQRFGRDEGSGVPYGTGFEARQRRGGRGMGRGR